VLAIEGISFSQGEVAWGQPAAANRGTIVAEAELLTRPTLKLGSQGAEVSELQATLKLLGYYDGAVDGMYRDSTRNAVSRFQQAAGVAADGIVGPATWNRLFPPPSTAAATPTPTSPPPQPAAAAALPTLRIGMTGSAVVKLQERLQAIGVYDGAVDGVFGAATQTAVKTAQRSFSLEPDGIVGPATWEALLQQRN
jgi:peptidoglycan hydrolase-like protein with peptidoglycan-binding domain